MMRRILGFPERCRNTAIKKTKGRRVLILKRWKRSGL
tara:strand:- start:343 stop:453 length:111 start_codon:yes stop_codon:yes gene_type:complete